MVLLYGVQHELMRQIVAVVVAVLVVEVRAVLLVVVVVVVVIIGLFFSAKNYAFLLIYCVP